MELKDQTNRRIVPAVVQEVQRNAAIDQTNLVPT
jgi:hypothetical protein